MCLPGGNETAHLREDRNQGVLPQKGRFTRHIGPSEQPDATGIGLRRWREVAVIGVERRPVSRQRLLHYGVSAPFNSEGMAVVDQRPYVIALDSKVCESACGIEH